jgi:hypothetical protein
VIEANINQANAVNLKIEFTFLVFDDSIYTLGIQRWLVRLFCAILALVYSSLVQAIPLITVASTPVAPPAGFDSIFLRSVSANGNCAIGEAYGDSRVAAFRSCGGVSTVLPNVAGMVFQTQAFGISADGRTVIGASGLGSTIGIVRENRVAFIWTELGGTQELATPFGSGGTSRSSAFFITPNGNAVAGQARAVGTTGRDFQAVRWQNGVATILDPAKQLNFQLSTGISDDESTVIGMGTVGSSTITSTKGFIWNEVSGFRITDVPPGGPYSDVSMKGISGNGKIISASYYNVSTGLSELQVILDQDGNLINQPVFANTNIPYSYSIQDFSYDGSFGIGTAAKDAPDPSGNYVDLGLIYQEGYGLLTFVDWFTINGGVLPTGFISYSLHNVSADGRYITGAATTADNLASLFVVDRLGLSSVVAEPGSGLMAFGLIGLLVGVRRKRRPAA